MLASVLSAQVTNTLAQAFISCRLDNCNSQLYIISYGLLCHLQSVQNAAACLVTGAHRCDHTTPLLQQLHWLPLHQRVIFKVAGLVHQSSVIGWRGTTVPSWWLSSALSYGSAHTQVNFKWHPNIVPQTHNRFGDTSFSAAGPRLWNNLPPKLWQPELSFPVFRQHLKTMLFDRSAQWLNSLVFWTIISCLDWWTGWLRL